MSALREHAFRRAFLLALFAFGVSLVSVFYSSHYATINASNSVSDIILSNTRVYDVDVLFTWGAFLAVVFSIVVVFLYRFRSAPYILNAAALFLIIRSTFVSLTHISPYPYHVALSTEFLNSTTIAQMFFTGDDQFFSGHVGLTFLMALIFWQTRSLRYIYLVWSGVFAVVVLLGHLHYSIDVFAAYFITYTIYDLSRRFFRSDYEAAELEHSRTGI